MVKISYAGCLGLSSGILSQFTLEMCCAPQPKIAKKKLIKPPLLGVQGHRCWWI